MPVNSSSWRKLPWTPRETKFDNDNALIRIRQWSGGSQEKYASAFLWNNGSGAGLNPNNYRLPVGDIYNGKLTLVPRAIFSAATIVSGAHGGLENVVGDEERDQLKRVITQIYDQFREKWNDRRQVPPWLRGGNEMGQTVASAEPEWTEESELAEPSLTAAVNTAGWGSMPVADVSRPWNGNAARKALWAWADGDMRQYRKGFLWWDKENPDIKGSYKLPIALPIDGTLTIVPGAVSAVASVLGGARDGVDIPEADMDSVAAAVEKIKARIDSGEDDTVTAAIFEDTHASPLVFPPASWLSNPNFEGPTPLAVTADGEVMGHIALWNTCHAGIGDKCVMAPKSAVDYKYFLNGSVLTADGTMVRVGKITMGTGHADIRLGYVPAADHYDNTGTVASIGAVGDDRFGIWYHGPVVPEATPEQIQQLRRSPISGDWRRINGNLELVAALAVNTPGFPIVSMTASGEVDSLCAAGVLLEDGSVAHDASTPLPQESRDVLGMVADLETKMDRLLKLSRKAQLRTLMKRGVDNGM